MRTKISHFRHHVLAGFVLLIAVPISGYPQDSLSIRDQQEIQLLAQRKLEKGLNDLLNTVTFEDLGEFERKAISTDSYGESPNQIFYDSQVIVEDDLNPEHITGSNTADLPVARYLANFELFYPKSVDRTIEFTDFRVSNLKKTDYYYVKVYFTSLFKLHHNQIATPYRPTQRVAEVRAERKGKKWVAYITRLAFVNDQDTQNPALNDVALAAESSILSQQGAEDAQEASREKEREAERLALAQYNQWLEKGDRAFAIGEYDQALEAYTEAEKRNEYDDLLPRRKIFQVRRAFEKGKETQSDLLRNFLDKASLAQKNRQYSEAVGYYKKAHELKPDSAVLGENIRLLNQKSSTKSELDEKYNAGKYAEVIKDYTRLLKKEKGNSDYYLGRGLAYVKKNDFDRALRDFDEAIKLDFANLAAFRARAEIYVLKNDTPKAIADLTSYLNIDGSDAEVLNRRAELRILTRNTDAALDDYTKAIALTPKKKAYHLNRGLLLSQLEKYDEAIADFTIVLQINEKQTDAWYHRGLAYLKLNQTATAGQDFDRLRTFGATASQLLEINNIAYQQLEKAKVTYNAGEFDNAAAGFDDVIHIQPTIAEAWYYRANSYLNKRDTLKAIEFLGQAISRDDGYSAAFFERAQLWSSLGNFENAAQDFRRAYETLPTFYQAMAGEAEAYFSQNLYDKAIAAYETIKANEKKIGKALSEQFFATLYNHLGQAYYRTQRIDKAIEEYSRAIDKYKSFAGAYFNRGQAYEAKDNLRRAIPDFKKAAGLDNQDSRIYLALGLALGRNEENPEAILSLTEAIEHDSENNCCLALALVARANLYYLTQQYAKATEDFAQAFSIEPDLESSQSLLNAGTSLLWLGKPTDAIKYLMQIKTEGSVLHQTHYALGCAYAQLFNQVEALRWFEKGFRTETFTNSFVRKDKLLDRCNSSFKNSHEFKVLVNNYLRK